MSWNIFVQDLPRDAKTTSDIPDDFRPGTIGKRSTIIERIKEVVPSADFSDPCWGVIDGDDWSIEVNIGADEDCQGFALHVRGSDAAIGAVEAILQRLGLRALAPQQGGFFTAGPDAIDSFRKWRGYRDQVVEKANSSQTHKPQ